VTGGALLPLLVLATSLVPALLTFVVPEDRERLRVTLNLGGAAAKIAVVAVLVIGVLQGGEYSWRAPLLPGGLDLVLRVDPIPLLFVVLSTLLWATTTIYAVGYLAGKPHHARFFGFFGLCVTATVGIALAGNLITFLLFYELLTVTTYPLIVHAGDDAARAGGRAYLRATLTGGTLLLVGTVWLHALGAPLEFGATTELAALAPTARAGLTGVFVMLIAGLGVKAALVPLHGWLPQAMVAPAPVSALLHAVAVVKAGVYGIVRVVHDLYGLPLVDQLGVRVPLLAVASVTVVYGSLRALAQTELKRRLAYSTVSQLSYVVLGATMIGVTSTTAGLVHLVHQGVMKVTLFYAAGNLERTLGVTRTDQLEGVGRQLPATMLAFTVAALGMVGLPPTVGFVTKWTLGVGAVEGGQPWVIAVLAVSSLLNAAYFLPLVARAWARPATGAPGMARVATERPNRGPLGRWLVWPTVATGASVLVLGLFAGVPGSPLSWAALIAEELMQP
jgi:multicomponent Na+:H+ antiporter subunit D